MPAPPQVLPPVSSAGAYLPLPLLRPCAHSTAGTLGCVHPDTHPSPVSPTLGCASSAAGAPSGQHAAGPLAVIGSAAAAAAAGRDQQQQAAGRRSNSQPRVLPGMGRPVSASHSRRNSSSDDGSGGLFSSADGAAAAAAITAAAGGAAVGGAGSVGAGVASRAGRGGAVGGISSMSSILGGFGASAFGAGASAGRGNAARGKWGVPVVPGPAAGAAGGGSRGAAGGAPTLQRRASTGDILALGDVAMGTSSSSSGLREQQHLGGQQGWQGLQRQSSGGLAAAGRPRSGSFSGGGSRPSTPRGRRAADAAAAAAAPRPHQQGQLQRQQSWHHMQQQQMLLLQEQELSMGWADGTGCVSSSPAGFNALGGLVIGGAGAGSAAADGVDVTAAAAAAAASTGWLLSRSQQRGGRAVFQEGQGNSLIVAWLMQQNGFVGAVAGAAAGDSAVAAGGQAMLLPGGGDNGNHNNDGDGDANGRGSSLQHGNPAVAAAGARPAAPLVACFEVLLVQPLMEQCRLTTVACWSLLLHEHRLLQRLSTIQGLFFQQQGDWVVLLCDALEPLLLAQQQQGCGQQGSGQQGCSQQQQQGEGGVGGGSGVSHGLASPVVLQLLLEGAVQQSCLAKMPEAECMSLQVGWVCVGLGVCSESMCVIKLSVCVCLGGGGAVAWSRLSRGHEDVLTPTSRGVVGVGGVRAGDVVQQSCLSKMPEAECMSLHVGWVRVGCAACAIAAWGGLVGSRLKQLCFKP